MNDLAPSLTLVAVGDCGPVHGPSDGYPAGHFSARAKEFLATADIRLANCERQYSDRPAKNARTPHGCMPTSMATIFSEFGFDVLTLANNHMMDAGPAALLDTRAILQSKDILVTGAGRDLTEAREPVIVERNGVRIGFLARCSALPEGSEADANRVGVAPLRVHTHYEERGPHAPVRVRTKADPNDLALLMEDIRDLKRHVDFVVLSHHAGILWVPRAIADYQVEVAHAAIDAGGELVLGHHPHILKGVEVYKDKPIFYSLGHFCMTKPAPAAVWNEPPWMHGSLGNHNDLDPDMALLPYGKTASMSMMVRVRFGRGGIEEVGIAPVMIDREYRPVPILRGTPEFEKILEFLDWSSQGLPHGFEVVDNEIRVRASSPPATSDKVCL